VGDAVADARQVAVEALPEIGLAHPNRPVT
jgi:hypothetical protein